MLVRTEYSGKGKNTNAVETITSVDLEILLLLKFMLSICFCFGTIINSELENPNLETSQAFTHDYNFFFLCDF